MTWWPWSIRGSEYWALAGHWGDVSGTISTTSGCRAYTTPPVTLYKGWVPRSIDSWNLTKPLPDAQRSLVDWAGKSEVDDDVTTLWWAQMFYSLVFHRNGAMRTTWTVVTWNTLRVSEINWSRFVEDVIWTPQLVVKIWT